MLLFLIASLLLPVTATPLGARGAASDEALVVAKRGMVSTFSETFGYDVDYNSATSRLTYNNGAVLFLRDYIANKNGQLVPQRQGRFTQSCSPCDLNSDRTVFVCSCDFRPQHIRLDDVFYVGANKKLYFAPDESPA